MLAAEDAAAAEPLLRVGDGGTALRVAQDAQLDAAAATAHLLRACEALGAPQGRFALRQGCRARRLLLGKCSVQVEKVATDAGSFDVRCVHHATRVHACSNSEVGELACAGCRRSCPCAAARIWPAQLLLWSSIAWRHETGHLLAGQPPALPQPRPRRARRCWQPRCRRGVVVALGAASGTLMLNSFADAMYGDLFLPRLGHLLELDYPAGVTPLRHGLMEASYAAHCSAPARGAAGSGAANGVASPDALDVVAQGAAQAAQDAPQAPGSGLQAAPSVTFTATTSAAGKLLIGAAAVPACCAPEHGAARKSGLFKPDGWSADHVYKLTCMWHTLRSTGCT